MLRSWARENVGMRMGRKNSRKEGRFLEGGLKWQA